jgi:hypothetical protein
MPDLKVLQDAREELRLCHLAAWLHDVPKAGLSQDFPPTHLQRYLKARNPNDLKLEKDSYDLWLLAYCHGIAHFEKEERLQRKQRKPPGPSSPFGFEVGQARKWRRDDEQVKAWLQTLYSKERAQAILLHVPADTRRPLNEVTLWSWSHVVAALYKAACAHLYLQGLGHLLESEEAAISEQVLKQAVTRVKTLAIKKTLERPTSATSEQSLPPGQEILDQIESFLDNAPEPQSVNGPDESLLEARLAKLREPLRQLRDQYRQALSPLSWRLLSVRVDGLEWILGASGIPDLLARRELLRCALDNVQRLLEEEFPLGTEVYRDENGSVFVVPNLELSSPELRDPGSGETLEALLRRAFARGTVKEDARLAIHGELLPEIRLDARPWRGGPLPEELPPIVRGMGEGGGAGHLDRPGEITADPEFVQAAWKDCREEVCIVCGLRPRGAWAPDRREHYRHKAGGRPCPSSCRTCKAILRGVCGICEERRADRAKRWARGGRHDTIWVDELADESGRLALVVGRFDLREWISGKMVSTLAARDPGAELPPRLPAEKRAAAERVGKTPSFARLQRIWETTRRFWQEIAPTEEDGDHGAQSSAPTPLLKPTGRRLLIRGTVASRRGLRALGPYHAYQLVIQRGVKLGVLWDPDNEQFITLGNLGYAARQLQGTPGSTPERAAEQVKQKIESSRGGLLLEEPSGHGDRNRPLGRLLVEEVVHDESLYSPVLPLLAEPQSFFCLLPADRALEMVTAIKNKYETEMGKVRNRLPLHLSIVFAHRRTPLRALLDAGRRMLERPPLRLADGDDRWRVVKTDRRSPAKSGPSRSAGKACGGRCTELLLESCKSRRRLTWRVPITMGREEVPDHYYPYVFWLSDKQGSEELPEDRKKDARAFFWDAGPCPRGAPRTAPGAAAAATAPNARQLLVHAADLEKGDVIAFEASTFDWIWLDSAARRFELAYEPHGARRGLPRRPYLLDELEILQQIWSDLSSRLESTQIHALRDLIESRRALWGVPADDSRPGAADARARIDPLQEVFRRFCRLAVANAEWSPAPPAGPETQDASWLRQWEEYAAQGWLTDTIELHLQILKKDGAHVPEQR